MVEIAYKIVITVKMNLKPVCHIGWKPLEAQILDISAATMIHRAFQIIIKNIKTQNPPSLRLLWVEMCGNSFP